MPSGKGSHGGRRPGAGRPRGAVSRRNGLFRVSLGSLARRYGEEAIRTLVTVMSDKHAPGMARLNAVVERITQHVHQRVIQTVDHDPVHFSFSTGNLQIDIFFQFFGQFAHQSREFLEQTSHRLHPRGQRGAL